MALTVDHGLSEAELARLARTILNWGRADYFIGRTLQHFYSMPSKDDAADLIHPIDMRKKITLLKRAVDTSDAPTEIKQLTKELSSICGRWADDRNLLAHGLTSLDSPTTLVSGKKQTKAAASELVKYEQRSLYLIHVVALIAAEFIGARGSQDKLPPLPERPE